jgi:hypothetical protein
LVLLVPALVPALLAGCTTGDNRIDPRLRPMTDCGAAIDHVREVMIARTDRRLDASLAAFKAGGVCGWGDDWGRGGDVLAGDASDDAPAPESGGGGGGPATGTGTNNQVAGVDEADIIKNDGQYIYLAQDGVFRIVDSWPAPETHEVSVTDLGGGEAKKLFVVGDRAAVYVATGGAPNDWYDPGECTYGYDCDFTGDGSSTRIVIFDITDRAAPQVIRVISTSGSLLAGRRIGTTVHTVVTEPPQDVPGVDTSLDWSLCQSDWAGTVPPLAAVWRAEEAVDEMREANRRAIMAADLSAMIPTLTDSLEAAAGGDAAVCSSLYASAVKDGASFTTIISVDLATEAPINTAAIVSSAGAVYASGEALYLAVPHQWGESDESTIHKFAISAEPADTRYLASGAVRGRALNQFALDERDGFLRIATTDGHVPDPHVESILTILEQDGDDLVTAGLIEGIAPTEDIRSVRFDDDRAFVVTFKKTDPLFAFDVGDPYHPEVLGELKIPGFSTYMHMLDRDHILSIGYDADDHGDFAYFDGVLLQIFDVSNPSSPTLAHRHVIGTRGSSSEALTNHLAFTWYPEKELLAIPMTLCEGGDDGQYGDTMTFSGLMVFAVDLVTGFTHEGGVAHPVAEDITCNNWWSRATSAVKRSLFLDDYVYSLSDEHLKVQDSRALGTDLVSLPL